MRQAVFELIDRVDGWFQGIPGLDKWERTFRANFDSPRHVEDVRSRFAVYEEAAFSYIRLLNDGIDSESIGRRLSLRTFGNWRDPCLRSGTS